jgi:hypothetical protein
MKKMGLPNPIQVVNDGQQAIDHLQGAGDRGTIPLPSLVIGFEIALQNGTGRRTLDSSASGNPRRDAGIGARLAPLQKKSGDSTLFSASTSTKSDQKSIDTYKALNYNISTVFEKHSSALRRFHLARKRGNANSVPRVRSPRIKSRAGSRLSAPETHKKHSVDFLISSLILDLK